MDKKSSEDISFGEWVRQRRHILDLTQQELADRVGCARITLRRIESGALKPSKELAKIMLEKLGAPAKGEEWLQFARGLSGLPLQSIPVPPKPNSNLPAPLTTFIGRKKEQSEVIRLITKHRLISLTGSGGVGKTRLSLKVGEQVLENYVDGVWLVELAPILDPLLVPRAIAIAVGLRDEPQRPVIDMLCDYLRGKEMLLILDNCEHLVDACAHLANALLQSCPLLKILATSREPLGILGEAVYRVPSLGLPDFQQLLDTFRDFESVELFEERAQLAQFDFSLTLENASSVAQICHRLDGIPLAIELAAAKVGTFSTEQIAKQLDDRFNLLTEGNRTALPRHQTLRASMGWSWGLLTDSEQILMRQLSVFAGGWNLEAAQAVCNGDVLKLTNSLVKKSLVVLDQETGRYHFHETIRQYANEKLVESGESNLLRDRHLDYFLKLAETAEPYLIRSEQIEWLPVLDADYENLRLAFEWAMSKESAEPALNLCKALGWFWEIRCYWLEGLNWSTRALTKPMQGANKKEKIARTRVLYTRILLEKQLGNSVEQILSLAEASLALAFETSDRRDIAIAKYFLADALFQRGEEKHRAFSLQQQSFAEFQELNEPFWQAFSFLYPGDLPKGKTELNFHDWHLQCIELARKTGERLTLADALTKYADWLFGMGRVEEAKKCAEESDNLYKQVGAENISLNPFLFAEIAWSKGDTQKARSIYMELYQRFSLLGEKGFRSNSAGKLGILAMEEEELDQARAYLEEALMLEREA
ncbi:MAG TPA: helix-turn-helix domain-containing protein, partial [Anaerolineales bacterium]